MLELIATEAVKSRASSGAVTATIDSLLVRTKWPRRSETRGSEPRCRQPASSRLVPSAPAARTTPPAVIVSPRPRRSAPLRTCVTAYPSDPSAAPSGRTSVTVRSASILTPRRSANHR